MIRSFLQSGGILSDAIETLVVRVVGIGLMFGMTTLTARLLGADEFGAFTAAWALAILLATLAPIGSDRVLVRNLSTVKSPEAAGRDTAAAHICTLVISIVIVAALGLTVALFVSSQAFTAPELQGAAKMGSVRDWVRSNESTEVPAARRESG